MLIDQYLGLKQAALEIAYDSGMINRFQTQEQWLDDIDELLEEYDEATLRVWDRWLSSLNSDDLLTVANGEETAMKALIDQCPAVENAFLDNLLNAFFEHPSYELMQRRAFNTAFGREAALLAFVLRCSAENPAAIGSMKGEAIALLERFGIEPREDGLFYHTREADEANAALLLSSADSSTGTGN